MLPVWIFALLILIETKICVNILAIQALKPWIAKAIINNETLTQHKQDIDHHQLD